MRRYLELEIDERNFLADGEEFQEQEGTNESRDLDIGRGERQPLKKLATLFQRRERQGDQKENDCSQRQYASAATVCPIEHRRDYHGHIIQSAGAEESHHEHENAEGERNLKRRDDTCRQL